MTIKAGPGLIGSPATETAPPRVTVIAELGVNHDGSIDEARRLVDSAQQAGADAVKLQCFQPARLLAREAELAGYQEGQAESARALLSALVLPESDMVAVLEHARSLGLATLVTPFSPTDVPTLSRLPLDGIKIASPDAVNPPLLAACFALAKGQGWPVLISTGASDLQELRDLAQRAQQHPPGGILLHCVSAYPTPMESAALSGIPTMRDRLRLDRIGYSDHTPSEQTGAWAVAAGACVLEKHLTRDRSAPGPDHAASVEPDGLTRYIQAVREAELALGPAQKRCGELERDVRRVSRQSVAAATDLPAGTTLQREHLTVMRPGTGIPAAELTNVIGRQLNRACPAGSLIPREALG